MSGMERRAMQFICLLILSSLSKANELQKASQETPKLSDSTVLVLPHDESPAEGKTNPDPGSVGTGCREVSAKEAIEILSDSSTTNENLKELQDLYGNKTLVICPPASSSQKDVIVAGTGTAQDLLDGVRDKALADELVRRMESKKVRRRHRSVGRPQQTASSHMVSCNEQTVAHMTSAHYRLLADSMKAHNCWSSRVARILSKLEADEARSRRPRSLLDPDEEDTYRGPSANEGYRIRCRFLLRFDTCRRNYLRLSELDPETNTVFDWPQPVIDAMNQSAENN